jgi:colicin import membrane protein
MNKRVEFEVTEERLPAAGAQAQDSAAPCEPFGAIASPDAPLAVAAGAADAAPAPPDAAPDAAVPPRGTVTKETAMSALADMPPGGFPRSIRGYNVAAVDEAFRRMSGRLEAMETQVQAEVGRADQSKRLLEQMTAELEAMRRRASDAEKRESAALEGKKRSEDEVARLVMELKEARERGKSERESAVAEARKQAEAQAADAQRDAAAQLAETQRQLEPLRQEAARLSAEVEALRARPAGGRAAKGANAEGLEAQRALFEAELESQRERARDRIDHVIGDVERHAAEAGTRVAAAYKDQEERVRAIGAECETLVLRLRDAVEAQLTQLPSVSPRHAVNAAARPALRADEGDDKRGREWRRGSWRNAS